MVIRAMRLSDEPAVQALSRTIYDDSLQRPADFHGTHHTLVAVTHCDDVMAYTTYAIAGRLMLLIETAVAKPFQDRGIGRKLMEVRLEIAKKHKLRVIGAVRDGNVPMIHLLDAFGFKPYERNETEVLYELEPVHGD